MNGQEWIYYCTEFEADRYNPEMMRYSPWSGHRQFVYDLIAWDCPSSIVELGSYYGCSAFAILQAVKDHKLNTSFYAVDTWGGDSFTENDYHEDIYGEYKRIQDTCFKEVKAQMLRMTFDEAVDRFEDSSIDLLHIDGSHLYEDVKHDFETWKDKVRPGGIILFHDISEDKLDGEYLGSHYFWEEIRKKYPYTYTFDYSFGLGVLLFEKERYLQLVNAFDGQNYQSLENRQAVISKDVIRKQFFELRDASLYLDSLKEQVSVSQEHLKRYEKSQREKDAYIKALEERQKEQEQRLQEMEEAFFRSEEHHNDQIEAYKRTIQGKDSYIEELKAAIASYETDGRKRAEYLSALEEEKAKQQMAILSLMDDVEKLKEFSLGKENYIQELLGQAEQFQKDFAKNTAQLKELSLQVAACEETIAEYQKTIENNNACMVQLQDTIRKYEGQVDGKDAYISELQDTIRKYEIQVSGKDAYIAELQDTISKYGIQVSGKDAYIIELQDTISGYRKNVEGKDRYIAELLEKVTVLSERLDVQEKIQETLGRDLLHARECIQVERDRAEELKAHLLALQSQIKKLPLGEQLLQRMEKNCGNL